ncbi:MAG TPA: hypothetical protein VKI44_20005 [Acetobacteraceae bacterium]|nr:hypothetical protein [Acetobacteraceae bacterium]
MAELRFVLGGSDADAAAAALIEALEGGDGVKATTSPVPSLPDGERKLIDPISLAALIVAIPGAVLAAWDIVDRIRKRRKAHAVVETARRLRAERQVETWLLTADATPRAVADLDADGLLDLVAKIDPPPR